VGSSRSPASVAPSLLYSATAMRLATEGERRGAGRAGAPFRPQVSDTRAIAK
jgi:hypothetical protein